MVEVRRRSTASASPPLPDLGSPWPDLGLSWPEKERPRLLGVEKGCGSTPRGGGAAHRRPRDESRAPPWPRAEGRALPAPHGAAAPHCKETRESE